MCVCVCERVSMCVCVCVQEEFEQGLRVEFEVSKDLLGFVIGGCACECSSCALTTATVSQAAMERISALYGQTQALTASYWTMTPILRSYVF